jgi:hypothetical protein
MPVLRRGWQGEAAGAAQGEARDAASSDAFCRTSSAAELPQPAVGRRRNSVMEGQIGSAKNSTG